VIALAVSLWAANGMISATILPSAVGDIGGLDLLSWATTAYVAASIVTAAAAGWTRAQVGGRLGLAIGALIFGLGATLSALAPSMPVLLVGRVIQGGGSGLAVAVCYSLIRTVFREAVWTRIFGLVATVWGMAGLVGPAIGGGLTELVTWRFAFAAMAVPAAILAATAIAVLPPEPRGRAAPPPLPTMGVLALGVFAIGLAGNVAGAGARVVALAAGAVLVFAAIRFDRVRRTPAFPSDTLSLSTPVGQGFAARVLLVATGMPLTVYGAYALQQIHGLSPSVAGYIVALEAIAWAIAATIPPRLSPRGERIAIRLGGLLVACGVGATGLALGHPSPWLAIGTIALTGVGYGIAWPVIGSRIFRGAREGEGDRTAAALPTLEALGVATGAALTGALGNALGIAAAGPAALPGTVAATFLAFGAIGLLGAVAAFRAAAGDDGRQPA
jgi:MFS family permease